MAALTPLPSLDAINRRVWLLAEFVHPRAAKDDYLGWVQRVLARYQIEARTIDGALSYEWAALLWTQLANTELEKVQKLQALYRAELEKNHAI